MKKIVSIFLMGFLFLGTLASCTQNDELDELFIETPVQGCCGEGGELDPPPPPPPPPGGGSGG
ncbi:hypothetical protein [Pseudotenacibaculum haliotis]|uniref:Lipoprotein n=1 Tax=Pseudotenacibaculum haliotis TaxID=1862138 RepID=A0ABW5LVD7_9FLAO